MLRTLILPILQNRLYLVSLCFCFSLSCSMKRNVSRCSVAKCRKLRGADKSLARPGRKQDRKHVRNASDFNNIETRAVINLFYFFLSGRSPEEIHTILTETLACLLPGRAKDSAISKSVFPAVCIHRS